MKHLMQLLILISVSGLLLACSESIDSTGQDGENSCVQTEVEENADGVRSITINAMDYENWVKLHLDSGITDDQNDWDLALRRYALRLNGGGSGSGYGIAQWVEGETLADASQAPEDQWTTDETVAEEIVFSDWYNYNGMTHQLTPKDRAYFVRGHDGMRYYALTVVNYYSPPPASDSGCVTLHWKAVSAPESMPENTPGTGMLPSDEEMPNMSGSEGTEADGDDPAAGCYSGPPMHMCNCESSLSECNESGGTWTEECACDQEDA